MVTIVAAKIDEGTFSPNLLQTQYFLRVFDSRLKVTRCEADVSNVV
jgi:hypothetical protein